jgi:ABC-type sugar transport system ATPase subunit
LFGIVFVAHGFALLNHPNRIRFCKVLSTSVSQVELRKVSKVYPGPVAALAELDVAIRTGERLAILGPSGSGKSTILRLIAGLEKLSAGSLWIHGRRADVLPPAQRDVGMVFQNPALYPHLSVFGNIAFGLRARRVGRAEVTERVRTAASLLCVEGLLGRRPRELSGGEAQRVALARAIARRPRILLLDEPMSSLDAPLRVATRADLVELHGRLGMTMVHVTHDQGEAMAIGQRVAVMDHGRLVQIGTPQELYDRPATRFIARFVGSPPMSLLPCRVVREEAGLRATLDGCETLIRPEAPWAETLSRCDSEMMEVGIRTEAIQVVDPCRDSHRVWRIRAQVRRYEPTGGSTLAYLAVGDHELVREFPPRPSHRIGDDIPLEINPQAVFWFDSSGRCILSPTSSDGF